MQPRSEKCFVQNFSVIGLLICKMVVCSHGCIWQWSRKYVNHYNGVIMSAMASQITSFTIVYSTVYSGVDQRKRQSSASLGFVRGIHLWPVNSPHKGPETRKMFPFDNVIMTLINYQIYATIKSPVLLLRFGRWMIFKDGYYLITYVCY